MSTVQVSTTNSSGGGGATRPLLKDEGSEELHGDPTVEQRPKARAVRSKIEDV